MTLNKSIALVTGASSGIGKATAGYKVYGTSRLRLLRRFAPAGLVDAGIRKDLQLDAVPVAKTS